MSTAALFPVFLKLDRRPCLVVGGGSIGESKVQSLLAAGARVTVVSPAVTEILRQQALEKLITWHSREFFSADLDGVFVVIAATSDQGVNELVYQEAERRGILCNAVDEPPRCHFYFPAVVRRGALQIAISTAGLSPALAQRLRKELEDQFGPEYEEWLQWLGRVRATVMQKGMALEARKRLLHRLASRETFDRIRQNRDAKQRSLRTAS
jgi:precorrin-2 dehydrogenase/sirohydrochlorin ferrochelatase